MTSKPVRLRFAPSPTGALHIGGVRTALYNYLWAKKMGGKFILRIEDTDRTRFVADAENYIVQALQWLGISPDESDHHAPDSRYAPYRQSDRQAQGIYKKYVQQLLDAGRAYYAFDSSEALDAARKEAEAAGNQGFKYDALTRGSFRNSLSLPAEEVEALLKSGADYVVRLRVERDEQIIFDDLVRGRVEYSSNILDDKVLLKSDGMPTYHLANVVDDYLMEISHVVRGEEWLPSTPTHVLLYRAFGWQDAMPQFVHLPLILRPDGKGKLSKRDGAKFGIPVFPLNFPIGDMSAEIKGFREWGFLPEAALNFLALLGWQKSGSDKDIYSLSELVEAFDFGDINKSGARFDFDKARWFNQQYIIATDNDTLAKAIQPLAEAKFRKKYSIKFLSQVARLLKERVHFVSDFVSVGSYLFQAPNLQETAEKEAKTWKKIASNWSTTQQTITQFLSLAAVTPLNAEALQNAINEAGIKAGELMPPLRLALAGTMSGAAVLDIVCLLGLEETSKRVELLHQALCVSTVDASLFSFLTWRWEPAHYKNLPYSDDEILSFFKFYFLIMKDMPSLSSTPLTINNAIKFIINNRKGIINKFQLPRVPTEKTIRTKLKNEECRSKAREILELESQ